MGRTQSTIIAAMLASAIFLIVVFGACLAMGMEHDMPVLGDCLHITSRSMVCPMGLAEQMETLEKTFVAQPIKFFAAFLCFFFLASSLFVSRALDAVRASPKRLWRERALLAYFLPLKRAFSRGILHPKVFDMAR